jgi:hypothetical protein
VDNLDTKATLSERYKTKTKQTKHNTRKNLTKTLAVKINT